MLRLNVVSEYLDAQQDLRAVQRFARLHSEHELPDPRRYQALIPLERPGPGQQYGFHVDLDACTGCKACVAACNRLNGLDADEAWRQVGLIHGGSEQAPVQQTVTSTCHHCLDPACASGCPVKAYEKDPETGIVRHLDDQCIGCRYCTLTCPYEVPRFNARLKIVRKCDMCSERLTQGEAPACVQACPNRAISIRNVDREQVLEEAQTDQFLPGAPSPGITAPSTTYTSRRPLPRNAVPADFYAVRPADPHLPLVVTLVLTELAAGALVLDAALGAALPARPGQEAYQALVACGAGVLALVASTAHLGRPAYAFRALLGLRRSWLSREVLAFGLFVGFALAYAVACSYPMLSGFVSLPSVPESTLSGLRAWFKGAGVACGLVGVGCSVMVYFATRRRFWASGGTALKFFTTTAVLGAATLLSTGVVGGAVMAGGDAWDRRIDVLAAALAVAVIAKLAIEASFFVHLLDKQRGELKRTALLMTGELRAYTAWRFITAVIGGWVLPLLLWAVWHGPAKPLGLICGLAVAVFGLCLTGELLERMLFFRAVSAPRMPGTVGQ